MFIKDFKPMTILCYIRSSKLSEIKLKIKNHQKLTELNGTPIPDT